jgi:hypothetical protein
MEEPIPFSDFSVPTPLAHTESLSILLDHVPKCITMSSTVHHTAPVPSFHISYTYKKAKHPLTFHSLTAAECISH